ncbi:MAG: VWA domain-containing protein [Thermodesulfobacteriota bacterium]
MAERNDRKPSPDLIHHLILFTRRLRAAGAGTTPVQAQEAARGLGFINLSDRDQFKDLLGCTLASSQGEMALFERCFDEYFLFGPDRTHPAGTDQPVESSRPWGRIADRIEGKKTKGLTEGRGASLRDVFVEKDFARLEPAEAEEIRRRVQTLAKTLALRLKRRRPSFSGRDRLDFRRTFRASLQSGGEPIPLKFHAWKLKPEKLVLLGDVSGSMDAYTRFFLTFLHGLMTTLPRTEAFVFSTRLRRITRLFRQGPADRIMDRLARAGLPLSSGTNIGGCLLEFLTRHRAVYAGRRFTAIIFSDGWDRGEPKVLEQAIQRLAKLAAAVIWLNPLAADPGFAPLATGMATARPYLTALLPFSRLADLARLGRFLEKREHL